MSGYPEAEPLPWTRRRVLTQPLVFHSRPGALAAEFARLMTCSDDADALLAALDAVNHLSGHPHLAAAFAPLVPAAAAKQPSGVVDELITTLVLGLAGEHVTVPQRGKGWLRPLRHRISSLLQGTATPVSAATHRGGWLDPMVFVQRMLNNPDAPRDDVIDALLRLAPDNRREAFRLTSGLSGPYAHAVFYALGGSVDLAPTWVNMAAARARQPDAVWTLTKRLPWLGLRYETELEGSIRDTPHRMVASPYDVDRVEADAASFLLHTPELRSGPAELAPLQAYLDHPQAPGPSGATLIAVALASPDDELAQLGIDITLSLFERRLLGPRKLGTALRQLGADRDRVDTVLDVVAMEHPAAVAELIPLLRQMA